MKPVIEIYEDSDSIVVEMSKKIVGANRYEQVKEITKFYKTEIKEFESAVDFIVLEMLGKMGFIPADDSNESLESVMLLLESKYRKKFEIDDRYENTNEKIVYKRHKQTFILDGDIVSVANEIKLVDIGKEK